jgi:aldose 1-epimerase
MRESIAEEAVYIANELGYPMRRCFLLYLLPMLVLAKSTYTAEKINDNGVEIVRLSDRTHGVEVSIAPSVGNRAYELKVHGKNLLYFPLADAVALQKAGGRVFNGIPFLAPWANRMAGSGFWANGKRYVFNPDLGSVRVDASGIAIHGMLAASPLWEIEELRGDNRSASVTSHLAFWKHPELMANWPFAHEYEMTYRLSDGVLEVKTKLVNLSAEQMPVSIGFHPYFNIPGVPRSEAIAHVPARLHVETNRQLVATGQLTPNTLPDDVSLKDHTFDDGFTGLKRDSGGHAIFSVEADGKKIDVVYGPKYQVAVIYAPPGQNFICFEPMTAITNGVNLAHDGKYSELETVAPGASWQESFWIRFSGF